jgi:tRNA nucleotidyltransferase (CCA-adding enzyme)
MAPMEVYLVGGAVRDELLNYPVKERDWVVVGSTPQQMLDLHYRQVGKDFPVFLHPQSKEEYALARTERKSGKGYTGFVCDTDPSITLEQDLYRRDLPVNAMARNNDGSLVDPYGGEADLKARLLRHVSPAFIEDPLRVLRVARFTARYGHLGFAVAADTMVLMSRIAEGGELGLLPAERIWSEIEKALAERSPAQFFTTLEDCGALATLFQELAADPSAIERLALAHQQGGQNEVLFAVLLAQLPVAAAQQLCQRLHAPRRFRELALLCVQFGDAYQQATKLESEELLRLLEQTDALRRAPRFEQFLAASALAFPAAAANSLFLRQALQACADVDIKSLAKLDLSGQELGQRIRAQRRQNLAQLAAAPAR